MLSKFAITDFLSRKLKNYTWLKRVPEDELWEQIQTYDPPEFVYRPFKHQMVAWLIGASLRSFLFYLGMGGGKTKLVLDLFAFRRKRGQCSKMLAIVPNVANIEGWRQEVETHTDFTFVSLRGTKKQRIKSLEKDGDVYIINYQGLQSICAKRIKKVNKKTKKTKAVTVPDQEKLQILIDKFDFIVLDEIHKLKNPESLTYKLAERITSQAPFVYGLTGTPMREAFDLWSQFYVVDDGDTFGKSFSFFREVFYYKVPGPFGASWEFDDRLSRDLARLMRNRSIYFAEEEMNDIPPCHKIVKNYAMGKEQREQYQNIVDGVIEADGNFQELENCYHKFRQCCSGYLEIKDEENDEKILIKLPDNPKLDLLLNLIEDMPSTSKMVVFYEYNTSGDLICEALKERKIKWRRLSSKVKDKIGALKTFKEDPDCYVLVVNWRSGGTGLNLQHANYCVYYESPVSIIERKQTEKRCHRTGQKKRTYIYDLQAKNTIEQRILEALSEGYEFFDRIVAGKKTGLWY